MTEEELRFRLELEGELNKIAYDKFLSLRDEFNDDYLNKMAIGISCAVEYMMSRYNLVPKTVDIDAIRAEADRRFPDDEVMAEGELSDILGEGFLQGAMWVLGYEYEDEQ